MYSLSTESNIILFLTIGYRPHEQCFFIVFYYKNSPQEENFHWILNFTISLNALSPYVFVLQLIMIENSEKLLIFNSVNLTIYSPVAKLISPYVFILQENENDSYIIMFYTPNSIKTKFICRLPIQPLTIMNHYLNHFRGNRNTLETKSIYLGNVFYVHVCWQQQNFSDSYWLPF